MGFEDCDTIASTGCEAKLAADDKNCGACGNACFYSCSNGTCTDPIDVATGSNFTCALLGTGDVYCWGSNVEGQVGNGMMGGTVLLPAHVQLPAPAVEISAGGSPTIEIGHACARLSTGEIYCWGSGGYGQLGDGNGQDTPLPVPVQLAADTVRVSAGSSHTCAIAVGGQLYCWGYNTSGQIGNGQPNGQVMVPVNVNMPPVSAVSAGASFTCAIDMAGKPFCWGQNQYGKLGIGNTQQQPTPMPVVSLVNAVGIAAGVNHACAWTAADLFCWGYNGQLALGIQGAPPTSPNPMPLGIGAVQLAAAGNDFGAALVGAGDLLMWGTGPLADGSNQSPVPKMVGLSGVVRFDAGGRLMPTMKHACAIKDTGELVCWGDNTAGQIGDGSAGGIKATPVTVPLP